MLEVNRNSCRAGVMAPLLLLGLLANYGCESPSQPASSLVVFEGARLIVGDGSPSIENGTFAVEGGQFVQVGPATELEAPEGAKRVDLAGTTVMPAIIDTHTHLNQERDASSKICGPGRGKG